MKPRSLLAHVFTEPLSWNVLGAEVVGVFGIFVIAGAIVKMKILFQ